MEKKRGHVFAFGRFNPPTAGHQKLFDKVKSVAKQEGSEHSIFPSHSHDSDKNPLEHTTKVKHLRKLFPRHNFVSHSDIKTVPHILKHLEKKGVTHPTLVVGSDRVESFKKAIHPYVRRADHPGYDPKKHYNFHKVNIVSAGHRDPDAEGVTGLSASKMREAAKKGDQRTFHRGLPGNNTKHKSEIYRDTRKGMGLKESFIYGMSEPLYGTGPYFGGNMKTNIDAPEPPKSRLAKKLFTKDSPYKPKVIRNKKKDSPRFTKTRGKINIKDEVSLDELFESHLDGTDMARKSYQFLTPGEPGYVGQNQKLPFGPDSRQGETRGTTAYARSESTGQGTNPASKTGTKGIKIRTEDTSKKKVKKENNVVPSYDSNLGRTGSAASGGGASVKIYEEDLPDNEKIRRWALKESTQKLFLEKYGNSATDKLLEAAFRIDERLGVKKQTQSSKTYLNLISKIRNGQEQMASGSDSEQGTGNYGYAKMRPMSYDLQEKG